MWRENLLIPSHVYVSLGAVIFGFSVKQIADPDLWWHLRNAPIFSNITRSPAWTLSPYGGRIALDEFRMAFRSPIFSSLQGCGLRGVLLLYFALLILIYTAVYYRSCRAGADCKDATVVTLLAIFLGVVSIGPRTLLFGWLCMVGLLLVLTVFGGPEKAFGCCRRCLPCGSTFTAPGSLV